MVSPKECEPEVIQRAYDPTASDHVTPPELLTDVLGGGS